VGDLGVCGDVTTSELKFRFAHLKPILPSHSITQSNKQTNMIIRKGDLRKTFRVILILLGWWIFSVTAGLYNKDYLLLYRLPIYLTVLTAFVFVLIYLFDFIHYNNLFSLDKVVH
jgi:hypothetical protein